MSDAIPTLASPKRVQLKAGGVALVRRATRSVRDKLLAAAEFREGDTASQVLFAQLAFRWGVVGVEGAELRSPETGQPIRFERRGYAGLGLIATSDVYDAIEHDEDIAAVVEVVLPQGSDGGVLTEEQAGN